MTTVAELTQRVNDMAEKVEKVGKGQSPEQLMAIATSARKKAEQVKDSPDQARNYQQRAETAKTKVRPIPDIDAINDHLKDYSVPDSDFCLPLISNLDLERGFGDVTFTRSTTATYIDKGGVLRVAEANVPRFEREGMLIEGASTNLISHSENYGYDNVKYVELQKNVIDGRNVRRFKKAREEVYEYIELVKTNLTAGTYTFSIYIHEASAGVTIRASFTDYITQPGIYTKTFTATDGFFRVLLYAGPQRDSTAGHTMAIACPQLEKTSVATSYIPTTGSPATRAEDVLTLPTVADTLGSADTPQTVCLTLKMKGDRSIIYSGAAHSLQAANKGWSELSYGAWGGIAKKTVGALPDGDKKFCFTYSGASRIFNTYINGAPALRDCLSSNAGTVWLPYKRIRFGHASRPYFGHIRNLRIWHKALTDSQVAML